MLQVSGTGIFPEVELSWATFNQVQRLIQKTSGKTCASIEHLGTPGLLCLLAA